MVFFQFLYFLVFPFEYMTVEQLVKEEKEKNKIKGYFHLHPRGLAQIQIDPSDFKQFKYTPFLFANDLNTPKSYKIYI